MNAVSYLHLRGGVPLPPIPSPAPFKVIVIAEKAVDAAWRFEVCTWLIRNGCLSFAAWGEACEAWHDDADHVNIADFDGRQIPEDRLVMTTWHDNEPLSKALWFVASVAFHPVADLENTVIVHVADHARAKALPAQYHAAADE